MTNPNYRTYLGTALQLQRWRDFIAHVAAYGSINTLLIVVWLMTGRGAFWPGISLAAWGLGLSSQHWLNAIRGRSQNATFASEWTLQHRPAMRNTSLLNS